MSSKLPSLVRLGLAGGECSNLAAPLVQKLQGKVPQATDADHAHAVCGFHSEVQNRGENCDASTKKGTCTGWIQSGRQFDRPLPIRSYPIGEPAVAADDDSFCFRAELMPAGKAGLAGEATAGEPTKSDPVADGEALGLITDSFDGADDFMSGDEWVCRVSPLILKH